MAATYDPALASDLDWVRFLIGDTDMTHPELDDQEILGLLSHQSVVVGSGTWLPYYAGASALDMLTARWRTQSGGHTSERVGSLALSRGGDMVQQSKRSLELREQGAALKLPRPRVFECL